MLVAPVDPMVTTVSVAAVVVPSASWSVSVVRCTIAPSSVNPDAAAERHVPSESLKHPAASWMPFAKVEVAELEVTFKMVAWSPWTTVVVPETFVKILPPVMVRPWLDASPPPATERPDAVKVLVAEPVFRMEPARVRPPVD